MLLLCGRSLFHEEYLNEIKAYVKENNLDVRFLGYRTDVANLVHFCLFGTLISKKEGLAFAGIELLAAGKMILGSDVKGINDYVLHGETGFVYDCDDIIGLSEGMNKLADKKLREDSEMLCKGTASNYSYEVSNEQRKKIYEEII